MAPVQLVGAVGQHERDAHCRAGCGRGSRAGRGSIGRTSGGPRRRTAPAPIAASRSRTPSSSSNRRPCAEPTSGRTPPSSAAGPRSGTRRASSARPWPTMASSSSGTARRTRPRSASTTGAYGQRAVAEDDAAAAEDHGPVARPRSRRTPLTSRVLPTPASPATTIALLRPSRARRSAARSRSNSIGPSDEDRAGDAGRHALDYHASAAHARRASIDALARRGSTTGDERQQLLPPAPMAAVTPGFLEQPGTLRILDPLPTDLVRIDLHLVIAVHLDLSLRLPPPVPRRLVRDSG